MSDRHPRGVFAGLATLDVVHRVPSPPTANQKITATAQFVAAGGPAANAAVTFAALGGHATLVTALGCSPVAQTIVAELRAVGVEVVDVVPDDAAQAPVSSVVVTEGTGDRSVVGGDAAGRKVRAPGRDVVAAVLSGADVVLVDGHHPDVCDAVAHEARDAGIRLVVDAGRWKPTMAGALARATDVVASADFALPGSTTSVDTAERLLRDGTPTVVVTDGPNPIRWWSGRDRGEVPAQVVRAVDTLAAGDVFHGAYVFGAASGLPLPVTIAYASKVAAVRCSMVGPRSWLSAIAEVPRA